jgi:hypothetical protein
LAFINCHWVVGFCGDFARDAEVLDFRIRAFAHKGSDVEALFLFDGRAASMPASDCIEQFRYAIFDCKGAKSLIEAVALKVTRKMKVV